ncbi:MAG: imidazole glycerol phosphate synthase subunit HisH 2 [Candidatus Woesearchaeota archaeon]|nr:MAG: imidazole glycerol phosphate synthase subunit HisH 2 [Candidatus Woesearchaeota archaeon]
MIIIIDYGCGNLGSIQNMIKKIGGVSKITSNLKEIDNAEKLILPGVGAFDTGIKNLHDRGIWDILNKKALSDKTPILGICLGMQLMTKSSEEGILKGLAWIDAETKKFNFEYIPEKRKIPNMGWNYIKLKKDSILFNNMYENPKFYFVHSYYVKCNISQDVLATAEYGFEYDCAFQNENIFGVQFHPEKSHKYGMRLLENFVAL